MNAVGVWPKTMGQGVTIGLLSTGADTNDPDYADNLAPGGYNYVDGNTDTNDTYGTGTVLTGVMAAEANNGGFVGVAPRAKVLEVKVLGPYGTLTDTAASQGITYAVGHGASVIAFPLYEIGPGTSYLPNTQTVVECRREPERRVRARLGRPRLDDAGRDERPAELQHLARRVGSCRTRSRSASEDYLNNFDQFTDSGPNVQIAAPGTSLLGDYPDNWPSGGWTSGSQSAASEVAAVAALLRSVYPTATAAQVVHAIIAGGRPLSSLQGLVSCGCMLDATGALAQLTQAMGNTAQVTYPPPAPAPTPPTPTYDNGSGAFWGDCSIPNSALNDPRANCQWYIPQTYSETGYYGGTHYGMNLTAAWPQTNGARGSGRDGRYRCGAESRFLVAARAGLELLGRRHRHDRRRLPRHLHGQPDRRAAEQRARHRRRRPGGQVDAGQGARAERGMGQHEDPRRSQLRGEHPGRAGGEHLARRPELADAGHPGAMQNAETKSVLLVFAAGNWGADHDNPAFVPTFDGTGFDNVLTVAAIDPLEHDRVLL